MIAASAVDHKVSFSFFPRVYDSGDSKGSKRMKSFKRIIATILLCITLFLSVFNSYSMTMTVQATEVALPVIDSLLALFGVEMGLGNQSDFFSTATEIKDFATTVANGGTVSMPMYGDVNFGDSSEVLKFMMWAQNTHSSISNSSMSDVAVDASILAFAKALDKTSYKNSGTSATNAMSDRISKAVGDYNGSSEALAEDVQDTFKVITGGSASGNNKNNMTPNRWDLFTAIASTFLFGASKDFNEFIDKLSTPKESTYTEYDNSFSDVSDGYTGSYSAYDNEYDTVYSHNYNIVAVIHQGTDEISDLYYLASASQPIAGYLSGSTINIVTLNSNGIKSLFCICRSWKLSTHEFYGNSSSSSINEAIVRHNYSVYFPIFSSVSAAENFLRTGDTSGIQNLSDTSAYPNFKSNVGTATKTVSVPLGNILDTNPTPDHLRQIAIKVLEKTDPSVGTDDYVPNVKTALEEAAGIDPGSDPDSDTDSKPSTGAINYTNILQKILAAIKAIPGQIWEFFFDPMAAIQKGIKSLLDAVLDILALLQTCWEELANYLSKILAAITDLGDPHNPFGSPDDNSGDSSSSSGGTVNLLNGLLLLVYILFMLLKIFLHLLEFIINVFKIPADPGFITGDFATGFNYIKSVQLSPLSISIYDFLMGLVHILVIFSVVKSLKHHIDKIHI